MRIDFHIESKESLREVVERRFVEGREDETIKKAASEYKKAATEYKERDTANTAAIFGSGEKEIYNQSKEKKKIKEGKGNKVIGGQSDIRTFMDSPIV